MMREKRQNEKRVGMRGRGAGVRKEVVKEARRKRGDRRGGRGGGASVEGERRREGRGRGL